MPFYCSMPFAPEAGRPLPITAPPFSEYRLDEAYDEMFDAAGAARAHYARAVDRLAAGRPARSCGSGSRPPTARS